MGARGLIASRFFKNQATVKNQPKYRSDEDLSWSFGRPIAVLAIATAVVLQNLPWLQVAANSSPVTNDSLPVIAILTDFVGNVPAGVPRLDSVASMGNWGSWSWLEWIITSATTAVTKAWKAIGLVELLQLSMPITAGMAFLLRKDAIQREKANTCQLLSHLLLHSSLKAHDLICVKFGAQLLGQQRHRTALLVLVVLEGHVLRARLVVGVVGLL